MQKKKHSLLEAITNVFVGYFLAVGTQYLVFPLFNVQVNHNEHFAIAGIFTIISVIRSYILRRIFNKYTSEKKTYTEVIHRKPVVWKCTVCEYYFVGSKQTVFKNETLCRECLINEKEKVYNIQDLQSL